MSLAIETIDLKKRFRKAEYKNILPWKGQSVQALDGISLGVKKEETVVIYETQEAILSSSESGARTKILLDAAEAVKKAKLDIDDIEVNLIKFA